MKEITKKHLANIKLAKTGNFSDIVKSIEQYCYENDITDKDKINLIQDCLEITITKAIDLVKTTTPFKPKKNKYTKGLNLTCDKCD